MSVHPGKNIRSRLEKHRQKAEVVSVRREPMDPFSMGATVLAVGRELALLADVTDLSADGFKIVRIADISRLERDGSEKWFETVLRKEGIIKGIRTPFEIDLSTWKTALTA